MRIYGDLHVHIGRTSTGKPVKITASPKLTLENISHVALEQKGLDFVGIVDAACSGVLEDLKSLFEAGELTPLSGGGYNYKGLVIFLGSEVELTNTSNRKEAHFLAYFPNLESITKYAESLKTSVTNPSLSTQRLRISGDEWLQTVKENDGVAMAAHAFTPHKGVYGNCVTKLEEMFKHPEQISALELGLSANTEMAVKIKDTHTYPYLSNSDAHSLARIGREFTTYELPSLDFYNLFNSLDKCIVSNHGLDPLLGKYYRSFCNNCAILATQKTPTFICPNCDIEMVSGVWDRILEIADNMEQVTTRPPYFSHVPLFMLPGIGPKTYERMLMNLGTEIDILYNLPLEKISLAVGSHIGKTIAAVRAGSLLIEPGGGGKYGKVTNFKKG